MSHKIRWTRRASTDLAAIEAYIAADRTGASQREVGDIIRKVDLLENFPKLGSVFRRTPEAVYHSVLSGKYRIVYHLRAHEDVIDITTIRHGAQDEPEL